MEQQLLNRLKNAQAQYAMDALKMPVEKTAYEYGYRAGIVAGYEKAVDLLLNMVEEEKQRDTL